MDAAWAQVLLNANLIAHAVLLVGALWCVAFPARRIYPMKTPDGWYYVMWALFGFIFVTNPVFVYLDWNTGFWTSPLRFWLAGPLVILGGGLVSWLHSIAYRQFLQHCRKFKRQQVMAEPPQSGHDPRAAVDAEILLRHSAAGSGSRWLARGRQSPRPARDRQGRHAYSCRTSS